jgi:hypothetical protein
VYIGAAVIGVVSLVAVLLGQPLVAAAVMLALPTMTAALLYPHYITPLVLFLIYSNAVVVAIHFHNVPTIAAALLPIALLIPLGFHLLAGRRQVVITGTLPFAIAFVLIQACGLPGSRHLKEAINTVQSSVIEGLAIYFLVTNIVRTRRDAQLAVGGLLLAGCFMGGLSLFQQLTGTFDNQYGGFAQVPKFGFRVLEDGVPVRQGRLCGPVGEQNRYAQVMLMLVPLGLCQFWGQEGKVKALAGVATALAAIGCVLAFSRGAAVGFALMLVLMTAMRQLKVRQLTIIGVGLLLLMLAIPQYSKRLASLGSLIGLASGSSSPAEMDGALRGRATVMLAAIKVAVDYPLLGVGPGMFNYYSQEYGNEGGLRALNEARAAHCLYLELAAEHGFPGLLCFLAAVAVSLTNLVRMKRWWQGRDRRMEYLASGYILALACYLTTGLFLHFSYARYFWLLLAIADATSNVGRTSAEEWLRNAGSKPASQEDEAQPC